MVAAHTERIEVIDSHTGGEPTRVVVAGGPDLGSGSMRARRDRFRDEFDAVRSAVVNEPRGSDPVVGALLCEPEDPSCTAGAKIVGGLISGIAVFVKALATAGTVDGAVPGA